ncbi:MAG TPA: hypothetical protein DDX98_00655 [Bacteroidales bacterium]|jgi:hypothetical protein|nr:hypothetical protein [Bacteroidales bacterium]
MKKLNYDTLLFEVIKKMKISYNEILNKKKDSTKIILSVVGCQRSGTTLLKQIFHRDINTYVFSEKSEVTGCGKNKLRLKPLNEIEEILDSKPFPIKVIKPLVESQNLDFILDYFKNARAIWIYRNYRDVSLSNIYKFGINNGIKDLKSVLDRKLSDWQCERVPQHIYSILKKSYDDKMDPYDAAALFWFVRNNFYFEHKHDIDSRVFLCKYEDLVVRPSVVMKRIYNWIGEVFPGDRCIKQVRSSSIGKGIKVDLSEDIEQLCQQMMERFDSIYFNTDF